MRTQTGKIDCLYSTVYATVMIVLRPTWSQKFSQVGSSDWIMCSDMSERTGRQDDGFVFGNGQLVVYMSL